MMFEDFNNILNKTLFKIENNNDVIRFYSTDGYIYTMEHEQDCCEYVAIDDINGDLNDLIGSPILTAYASVHDGTDTSLTQNLIDISNGCDSSTWTFYKFATIKGYVDIRWFGTSNGYYSEGVSFNKSDECYLVEWRDKKLKDLE